MKILRASVMRAGEWYKTRDPQEWKKIRQQVLERDKYTCVYCAYMCPKFMSVNHIGAEDVHDLSNLETVCQACHSVLHLGANAVKGLMQVFDCKPELKNMAEIVRETRRLVEKDTPWDKIAEHIIANYASGDIYGLPGSVFAANEMLHSIPDGEFRGYLPEGMAVLFCEGQPWNGFAEKVHRWQCITGAGYRYHE